jgi:uncharacterized protein (DUF4415 family)
VTNDENITIISRDSPRRGKTDWAAVDALTDEDIAKAVANDPDAVPIDVDWSDAVLVMPAKKTAISIRLDEDVLKFFKKDGDGYQRRINAVLRSYMLQKAKRATKPKKRAWHPSAAPPFRGRGRCAISAGLPANEKNSCPHHPRRRPGKTVPAHG